MAIDEVALAALLPAWRAMFGDRWVTARHAVEEANEALVPPPILACCDFRAALYAFGRIKRSNDARGLGSRLAQVQGRVVNGLRVERAGGHLLRWRVVRSENATAAVAKPAAGAPPAWLQPADERIAAALERIAAALEWQRDVAGDPGRQ